MNAQLPLYPDGLSQSQIDGLYDCVDQAELVTLDQLLAAANQHLKLTREVHKTNRMVNVGLATAIVEVIQQVVHRWTAIPASAAPWLRGAMHYFATSNDDEPDFHSPIGFEDDAEILNACLRFAGLHDLCLNVEDYDDA